MTVTVSVGILFVLGVALVMTGLVTWACKAWGLFENTGGNYLPDTGWFFSVALYIIGVGIPTLLAWAVWATWFK